MPRRRRLLALAVAVAVSGVLVSLISAVGFQAGATRADPGINALTGIAETKSLLGGLAQHGNSLGAPSAPTTIVVFVDLKDARWQQWYINDSQELVDRLVRPGRARLELRLVNRVDRAARTRDGSNLRNAAYNAAEQGHLFDFASLIAYNQGIQTDAWASEKRLSKIASSTPGGPIKLDTTLSTTARASIQADDGLARSLHVTAVPAFFIRATSGTSLRAVSGSTRSILRAVRQAHRSR